jgi:ABC-type antimicrobial peptide transport system permease subunit
MSYPIATRTPEIGIRMALGASPRTVLRSSLRDAVGLILAGTIAGVPIALVSTTALRSLLFGLEPGDPLTLLAAITLLVGSGLLAAYVPARRGSRGSDRGAEVR